MMSPRWQHSSFLTSLSLIRRAAKSYSRTRHSWESPRTQGWGWSALHRRDRDRLPQKGKRSSGMLVTLLFPWAPSTRQRGPPHSQACGFSGGKKTQGGPAAPASIAGHFIEAPLWLGSSGVAGESVGLSRWEWDWDGKRGGPRHH